MFNICLIRYKKICLSIFILFCLYINSRSLIEGSVTYCNNNYMGYKCENNSRIYVLDFSPHFMRPLNFENVQFLLKNSINEWFDEEPGKRITIITIYNYCFMEGLCDVKECGILEECIDIVETLSYTNVTAQYFSDLIFFDDETAKGYGNHLIMCIEDFLTAHCSFNSLVIFTHRIVIFNGDVLSSVEQSIEEYCVEFAVILLGRNESDATKYLDKNYGRIVSKALYNVPDYNCVENLVKCIPPIYNITCKNASLNDCTSVIPTTTIATTKFNNYPYRAVFILGFSTNVSQSNLTMSLNSLIEPLQDVHPYSDPPFSISVILSSTEITPKFETIDEFKEYISNITAEQTVIEKDGDGTEIVQRIKLAEKYYPIIEGIENPYMIFLTDYFSNAFTNESSNLLFRYLLKVYVYDSNAYTLYRKENFTCYYMQNFNISIPFYLPRTSTSTSMSTSTSVLSTSRSTEQKTTSTIPQLTEQKNGSKTLFLIIGSIFGGIIAILCACIVVYRQCSYRKKVKQIRIDHQNQQEKQIEESRQNSTIFDEWELTWDKLQVKTEELGSGAYGQVMQGKLLEIRKGGINVAENKDVAIKILQTYTNEKSKNFFLYEIQVMKQITGHKNIVKMIGCVTVGDRICMVLEFCPYRDLLQYVKSKQQESISFLQTVEHLQKEFLIFGWQILHGMQFLASKEIIHRDLAARNILIDEFKVAKVLLTFGKSSEIIKKLIKISDFGLCVQSNDKIQISLSKNVKNLEIGKMPLKWLAIESLKNYEFSLQSDIWAFGIVLYEMYSFGEIPFNDIDNSNLLQHLEAGNRLGKPELSSEEIYQIMLKCWNPIPSSRPCVDEIITIFTAFLENATLKYGYIDLRSTETTD